MKKFDIVLASLAIILFGGLLHRIGLGGFLMRLSIGLMIIIIMIYWKLIPYKNQLSPRYLVIIRKIEKVLTPIFNFLSVLPKFQFGAHISMDLAPLIICSILILLLIII